ncbi:MAG: hypothetical protein GY851_02230, partial [bacterium]|nr:hypothetical protein [bacterium]
MEMIAVDLNQDGRCDWSGLVRYRSSVRSVVQSFSPPSNLANRGDHARRFKETCPLLCEEAREVGCLAGVGTDDVVLANASYDLASSSHACTGFAIDGPAGPLHGHCLDWDVGADVLREQARIVAFALPNGRAVLFSLGWPGFLGVFFGWVPGFFAVTLNAAWSTDPRECAAPLGYAIRQAMSVETSFDGLVSFLTNCTLTSDCLLLVTGARPGEMVVVERTPTRAAVREAAGGLLVVT